MRPPFIACAGRKGGTGKTSLALALAAHYARDGRRVLLIDLDPQGSASLAMGIDAHGGHLAAALTGAPETVQYCTISETLDLLPGGPELENADPVKGLRHVAAGIPADVVLIDCPPGHPDLDRLALAAADVLLVATEAHRLGIAGAARVLSEARNTERPPLCAVVLGRVDDRRALDRTAPDLLAGALAAPVFKIRTDAALADALNRGALPPPTGRAAADVGRIAAWIAGITQTEKPRSDHEEQASND